MTLIPVVINNRNLLTWPKAMLNKLKTMDGVSEIIIIDNDSTYPPLLEWYQSNPCEIIRVNNIGHTAPWDSGLVSKFDTNYIVTDPDLGLDDLPTNTIDVLSEKLNKYPDLGKIGLGLNWEEIDYTLPIYRHLQSFDRPRWESSRVVDDIFIDVAIDTTFALYKEKKYFIGGGSLSYPYKAKHYPWYFSHKERELNEEYSYYLNNASESSLYKVFLDNNMF